MHKNGFTLIELSVVIVIIGLIVAGIVAGQSLVEQAKLRAYVSDMGKYLTAVNSFRLQYNYYPGDFPNANDYWSNSTNGNGNGSIYWGAGTNGGSCNNSGEGQHAWYHLGQSGLVEKEYTFSTGNPTAGIHVPYAGGRTTYSLNEVQNGDGTNHIWITSVRPYGWYRSCPAHGAGLTQAQAKAIDLKLDDGNSNSGSVRGQQGNVNGETAPSSPCISGGNYNIAQDNISCAIRKAF